MKRRLVAAGVSLAVVVALVLLGAALVSHSSGTRSPLIGQPAPPLSGTTLTGKHYTLRHNGRGVTVVNIWASWCGPCRQELPLISRLARSWSHRGVRVVTVNTEDGPVAARTFLHEVRASDLLTVSDPQGRLAVSWGATGVPETFVVGPDGRVRGRKIGVVTAHWLSDQVARWTRT